MTRIIEGDLERSDLHLGIAAARWNQAITEKLVDGALTRVAELGIDAVTLMWVPGSLELPIAARELALSGCDAVVAIGAVVKGETDHYGIVVGESARGLTIASLETGVPITNAILAVHEYRHAVDRAGTGPANKGVEAVEAALNTASALHRLRTS